MSLSEHMHRIARPHYSFSFCAFHQQLDRQVELFRTAQNELAEARERYKEGSTTINELARELAQVRAM